MFIREQLELQLLFLIGNFSEITYQAKNEAIICPITRGNPYHPIQLVSKDLKRLKTAIFGVIWALDKKSGH